MPSVPPWLDFSPSTFASAAEAGQRLQQGQEQIGLERQKLAQSAAMESARLNQAAQEANMEHQARMEQMQKNFLLDQTQQSVTKAYHDAQIGLGKQKLDQAVQDKAKTLADRQSYAMAIAGGTPASEALAKFPGAWSAGTTDLVARGANRPNAYEFQNYKTLQSAYLNATKEYEKSPSPEKARIALNYRNQVQDAARAAGNTGTPSDSTTPSDKPVTEIIRLTKDGKRAVFNADTKQFLRYAD